MDYKHIYTSLEELPMMLTKNDIANIMQVTSQAVSRWIKLENLPAIKVNEGRRATVRVLKSDFLAWLGDRGKGVNHG